MPKCPDCKGSIELELVVLLQWKGNEMKILEPDDIYCKCPRCKGQYDPDNIEE